MYLLLPSFSCGIKKAIDWLSNGSRNVVFCAMWIFSRLKKIREMLSNVSFQEGVRMCSLHEDFWQESQVK